MPSAGVRLHRSTVTPEAKKEQREPSSPLERGAPVGPPLQALDMNKSRPQP